MIYLKKYENSIKDEPQVGDYVIIYNSSKIEYNQEFVNFINNSIGYIWKKPSNYYFVKYFNIPKNLLDDFSYSDYSDGLKTGNTILVPLMDIKYFSQNKEELKLKLVANKYNI